MRKEISMGATDYRRWVTRTVPKPSEEQMRAFAHFVAQDHSWYKKLPLLPPGEPFFLYLAPNTHRCLVRREDGGPRVWRDLVRDERNNPDRWGRKFRVGTRDGDVTPDLLPNVDYHARGRTSDEYRQDMSCWSYWNFGPPGQPRPAALAASGRSLRAMGDNGDAVAVPRELLKEGLVYLRGTVSGYLGPQEEQYARLRAEHNLPSARADSRTQIEDMVAAMRRVTNLLYR
jgi:hypothetical protein